MTGTPILLLSADDYALTDGVSRGIEELAEKRRLSATSAMVTTRHWTEHARRLSKLRDRLAVGLHFNLTLGAPVGDMPQLAPRGRLPSIGELTRAALLRRLDAKEIETEARRQLERFENQLGAAVDFVDGHQHVHALPQVRDGVLAAIAAHAPRRRVLIRNPADTVLRIRRRGCDVSKALLLAGLSAGFGRTVRQAGHLANDSFGGITSFRSDAAERDLLASMSVPGRLHIAMCHPGYPDEELAAIDPVTDRRQAELDAIMRQVDIESRIWHPRRGTNGPAIDWQHEDEAA